MTRIIVVGRAKSGKTTLVARLSAETGVTAIFDDFNHRRTSVESLPGEWIIVVQRADDLPRPYQDLATRIVEHTGGYRFTDAPASMKVEG